MASGGREATGGRLFVRFKSVSCREKGPPPLSLGDEDGWKEVGATVLSPVHRGSSLIPRGKRVGGGASNATGALFEFRSSMPTKVD